MLPPNAEFLLGLTWNEVDNTADLTRDEKHLILTLVRLFFGPAQKAGAVHNVSDPVSLVEVWDLVHASGERFDQLEEQTSLPDNFFSEPFHGQMSVILFVAKQANDEGPASYFVYEPTRNLSLYIGPDFLHELPTQTVINCLVLNNEYRPTESHTMRI